MFSEDEIKGYKSLIKSELEGKDPDDVFSEKAIKDAIGKSMDSIAEIRKAYSDSDGDKWSVSITDDDIETADEKTMKSFNDDLKISFSSAAIINYAFYKNDTNGESFTGNSSAFLEKDGKWYLSFSSLIQSELINYLEV